MASQPISVHKAALATTSSAKPAKQPDAVAGITGCFVPQLVALQSKSDGNALALSSRNEEMSYSELDEHANQLANHLRSVGVGADSVVGVFLQRSLGMTIAALGILRAGAAYLPLDPSYPPLRLTFMLNDARVRWVVTDRSREQRLPAGEWNVITLDESEYKSHSRIAPSIPITCESLAYVIYTSGSTGQPKGVQITHAGLLNLVSWHIRTFSVGRNDRASQVASPAFDAAMWEIWPYLAAGASVHFADEETRLVPQLLQQWMIEQGITIGFAPTPMAERLITMPWPSSTQLRVLLTGADRLHRFPPESLPFTLVNNYGPTECTVVTTSAVVRSDVKSATLPTIGWPIDNVAVYVVDERLQPVPQETVCELYIGGIGLARGYVNLPDLTAQKFIPNPFSSIPGDRLYKTGDLVRLLPSGELDFVGRVDEQIKIRGFRVEPQEVEAALARHSDVHASVVVARKHANESRLVAYIQTSRTSQLRHSELRDLVAQHVPDYMVPAIFVRVQELPFNASGKLDRARLPEPDAENVIADHELESPRSIIEQRIAGILAELLGISAVGMHDNFFYLGGHSLLGTQVIARIRSLFDVDIPLRTIFDRPTVADLSAEVEQMLVTKIQAMSTDEIQRALELNQR